jgi:gamma-glutamyltranspeptidase/glutathione hydrolase
MGMHAGVVSQLGATSAGHHLSAGASAEVLADGGNAIDAAVAGVYAACTCEPTLTGPGGAGFATVHLAHGSSHAFDFFASVPGIDRTIETVTGPVPVDVLFGATTQTFHVGPQSCAVPGFVAGTLELHARFGSLPLARVLEPAIKLAGHGVQITPEQSYCHSLLERIVTRTPQGKAVFAPGDHFLATGEIYHQPDLAAMFETLVQHGADSFYRGEIAEEIVRWSNDNGALLSASDLANYQVTVSPPVRTEYRGIEFLSVPPPSSGGALIAFSLHLLERARGEAAVDLDSAEGAELIIATMSAANAIRGAEFDRYLYGGDGLVDWLLSDAILDRGMELLHHAREHGVRPSSRLGNTTHHSVIDAAGNAVAITTTTGCGSGEFVGRTGIHLNNMMGEEDLLPVEHTLVPGQRLTSMMSPSLMLIGGRPLLATGSAGSNRIRSAVLQTLVRVIESRHLGDDRSLQLRLEDAVQTARMHAEGSTIHAEPGIAAPALARLRELPFQLNEWPSHNLFFGGVNMVARDEDGSFASSSDNRRGGGSWIVEGDGSLTLP